MYAVVVAWVYFVFERIRHAPSIADKIALVDELSRALSWQIVWKMH
jgi:hypothetical protein